MGFKENNNKNCNEEIARKNAEKLQKEKDLAIQKERVWTKNDLESLVKNSYKEAILGEETSDEVSHFEKEAIAENKAGDPLAFEKSLSDVNTLVTSQKRVMIIDGDSNGSILEHKEPLTPEIGDALYGLIIRTHITSQNFYITLENGEPIIHDNNKTANQERISLKENLQKVLEKFKKWTGQLDLKKYLAIQKFWESSGDDKHFFINWDKSLNKVKDELVRGNSPDDFDLALSEEDIKNVKSNPTMNWIDKTFLLAYHDGNGDDLLRKTEKDQQTIIQRANNPLYQSSSMKMAAFLNSPVLNKGHEALKAAVGLMILGKSLQLIFWKERNIWERILGYGLATCIGIKMGGKVIDGSLNFIGATWLAKNIVQKNPIWPDIPSINSLKSLTGKLETIWTDMQVRLKEFGHTMAGPNEWLPILMNPTYGKALTTMPVANVLNVLTGDTNIYWKYIDDDSFQKDKKILESIPEDDREELIPLFEHVWKRQKQIDSSYNSFEKGKTMTLATSIDTIRDHDYWLHDLLKEWNGNEHSEKSKLMRIITKDIDFWGDLTYKQIKDRYSINANTNSPWYKHIIEKEENLQSIYMGWDYSIDISILTKYFQENIIKKNYGNNEKLRDIINGEATEIINT